MGGPRMLPKPGWATGSSPSSRFMWGRNTRIRRSSRRYGRQRIGEPPHHGSARIYATGKRKTAVARVYIKAGAGRITVNGREFEEYLPVLALRAVATQPLVLTGKRTLVDVDVNIGGGGPMSQAESVKFGIAKALQIENPELRTQLKRAGFLTRDARIKERKKYGQPGARKRFQFSKR